MRRMGRGSLDDLSREDRMLLMRFVCSFAWADLEITLEERRFVAGLIHKLQLDPVENHQVQEWLTLPPDPESLDPSFVPLEHRELFLQAIEALVAADGELAPEEAESLVVLRALIEPQLEVLD
jgi:hypothetical protein